MEKIKIKSSEIITEILRSKNNPRNSEGDFALLKDGRILFAYCRYSGSDANDDAPCNIAGMISDDDGKTFKHLNHYLAKASDHGVQNIMCASLLRLDNGELCLFYLCKVGVCSSFYLRRATADETHFGEPECCVELRDDTYYVINNCRICKRSDGSLIIPAANHQVISDEKGKRRNGGFAKARFFGADANGRNPHILCNNVEMPYPSFSSTGLQEPGAIELPDGRIYSYYRTDLGFQFESFSSDGGKSFSVPVQSRFTSPESPMLIMRNPFGGKYYALWNPVPNYNGRYPAGSPWITAGRTPFVMAQSDNGIDFSEYTVIESDPERGFCYPAMHFMSEKEMLLSYCCGGKDDGCCLTRTRIRKIIFE